MCYGHIFSCSVENCLKKYELPDAYSGTTAAADHTKDVRQILTKMLVTERNESTKQETRYVW